ANALGEVYQYTLEAPGDADHALTKEELTERRTVQDWVVRPLLRSIPGVAEINSTGGYVKQYESLVDPQKLRYYNLTIHDGAMRLPATTQMPAAASCRIMPSST
ncbi:MAG: efflux RND transporter permease subunit, partial [Edaphobacter sp.]